MVIVYFLLLIGPLVFAHELGHFLVAKAFRLKVLKFSLGFGPVLIGKQFGETYYQIAGIPLGGFVKFLGDVPGEEVDPEDLPRSWNEASRWKRFLVIAAGPMMSLIFPVFVLFFVGLLKSELTPASVGLVIPNTPAEQAGLKAGDMIREIDGTTVHGFEDLQSIVEANPEQELDFVVQRQDKRINLKIRPALHKVNPFLMLGLDFEQEIGRIGISQRFPIAQIGVTSETSDAFQAGLRNFDIITSINGRPIEKWIDLERELAKAKKGQTWRISYLRPQKAQWGFSDFYVHKSQRTKLTINDDIGIEDSSLYLAFVRENGAASKAGFRLGDKIVEWNGVRVKSAFQVYEMIRQDLEGQHKVVLLRKNQRKAVSFRITKRVEDDRYIGERPVYDKGFELLIAYTRDTPVPNPNRVSRAAIYGVWTTVDVIEKTVFLLINLFQGNVSRKSVGGPIMIAELAAREGREGTSNFLVFLAFISVNLGILNLLPIPVLDGGNLVILSIEAIRRRSLTTREREIVNIAGLLVIVALVIFAFTNDIGRYWDKIVAFFS